MSRTDFFCVGIVMTAMAACSHYALTDPHSVLDPPNHTLRGRTAADDRPESDCDPIKKPDGTLEYQCVVHKFPDYNSLLDKIDRLEVELKACQSGRQ